MVLALPLWVKSHCYNFWMLGWHHTSRMGGILFSQIVIKIRKCQFHFWMNCPFKLSTFHTVVKLVILSRTHYLTYLNILYRAKMSQLAAGGSFPFAYMTAVSLFSHEPSSATCAQLFHVSSQTHHTLFKTAAPPRHSCTNNPSTADLMDVLCSSWAVKRWLH